MQSPAMPSPATIGGALIQHVYDGEVMPPEPEILSLFLPAIENDLTIRYRGKVSLAAPMPPMRNVTGWMN